MSFGQKNTYLNPKRNQIPDKFPKISQPNIIGKFSVGKDRCYIPSAINCKYIKWPANCERIYLDLNKGYEHVQRKPESASDEKLDHLLTFIVQNLGRLKKHDDEPEIAEDCVEKTNQKSPKNLKTRLSIDVVCFRGLLRLIMCTPYETREPWTILATRFNGTLYLCALETEEKKADRLNQDEQLKRILSYGFKFEQYLMSGSPTNEPNPNEPVNESEEFCCMFKTHLENHRILYGAEMDGLDSNVPQDFDNVDFNQLQFVELKVKLREETENQKRNYLKFKLRNWWCQCFLVNIRKLVVGTRNQKGIVQQLTILNVKDLPKQSQNYWSPAVCMKFCNEFLDLVKAETKDVDCANTVFRFDYDPKCDVTIKMTTHRDVNQYSFLPEWYISALR